MQQYRGEIKDKLGTLPSRRTKRYMTWVEAQKAAERLKKKYGERYEILVQLEKENELDIVVLQPQPQPQPQTEQLWQTVQTLQSQLDDIKKQLLAEINRKELQKSY